MTYKWESEEDKIRKSMRISPAKKLAWLEEMRQFLSCLPKKTLSIRSKIRDNG
jgi:hypothetical protein